MKYSPSDLNIIQEKMSSNIPTTSSFNAIRAQLNQLKEARLSETSTVKMLSLLKALANIHVLLGIIMMILSGLADYASTRKNTIRLHGLEEICSFYFVILGCVGICGSASYRRGIVIAYLVMCIHSILIFVPAIIIVSSFDIHFYQHECWGECDWHLLATSFPSNSQCQIFCGDNVNENMRRVMTRLGTDYRLDAGLISAAILELLLAVVTLFVASRTLCAPLKEISDQAPDMTVELQPLNETNNESSN
ncbi:unnamed protein product [Caenorhabditis angaria]|uniref:Uncharacterized protein n=1 Tax=Caenorhabditis angaria TaxID=860376 RepID=A0A9P1N9K9_9PELO|nr:unnamed protein product [Caenorhabditis angaria]